MTPSEREDLLARHFDGTLDDASAARLETLLSDPDAWSRFRGLARIHGLLLAREAGADLSGRVLGSIAAEEPRRKLTDRVMATLRERPRARRLYGRRPGAPWAPILAAAGLLFGVVVLATVLSSRRPPSSFPRPVTASQPEPSPVPPAPPEAPAPAIQPPAAAEAAPGAAKAAPQKPLSLPPTPALPTPAPAPPPPPPPAAEPLPPPKPPAPTTEPARRAAIVLAGVEGTAFRRRAGAESPLTAGAEVAASDVLFTRPRRAARLAIDGLVVTLERGTALASEIREDGSLRIHVSAGLAFFEASRPLTVTAPEAEIIVTGTSFQVERDEKRTQVAVLEGAVRFRNEKGEVAVRAGQRSGARAGERPSAPAKADVEALAAWRRRPELAPNPERNAFTEHEPGRRLPGLAVAAPFSEGEAEAGRLARATAELLDSGLVLGHHWRDVGKRRWINVDRGMEAELRADGTPAAEAFTDRARKATADYLDHARAAAGVTGPVPMIVQFRNHYEKDLEVCEVASSGWTKAAVAQLKAFYAQLLEKHRPAYRLEMRFQGVDDTYDYKGQRRTFFHGEADARIEGYMAPRSARHAVAFFLNPEFGTRAENAGAYAKIFAEMVEFLYARRR